MTKQRQELGRAGEARAASWYEERGFVTLAKNWRCREGELDLVVRRGELVVFCEVKTRSSTRFGTPAEAVTVAKQRRIRRLALRYLAEHPQAAGTLRFDVAAVTPRGIEVIEAAF